ncbi:MAG: hypothetical protein LBL62_04395 [Planctomycetaceae bacterium]|jgi:hypothetical protein|nr:hypothetical protein [Planctomycetaceae bacterium]
MDETSGTIQKRNKLNKKAIIKWATIHQVGNRSLNGCVGDSRLAPVNGWQQLKISDKVSRIRVSEEKTSVFWFKTMVF